MGRKRAILHIDMDAFFVSVERVLNPSLRGKPVIVGGNPESRGVVSAASYEARKYGIASAMPLKEAARLCPEAVFLPVNFEAYLHYAHLVREIIEDYTPYIEHAGLDEAYLDLTSSRRLFGEPRATAEEIRKRIRSEIGLPSSAGLSCAKVVSKVASAVAKPDGFIEVPPGKEKAFLAPLPVRRLPGIGASTARALAEMGIHTIGELSLLPREALESLFGSWGVIVHEYSMGIDHRRVETSHTVKSISRETTFEEDTIDYELVRRVLLLLCEKCSQALRGRGLSASRVTVKLRRSDFKTFTRSCVLKNPTSRDQVISRVAFGLLEKLLDNAGRVRLVGVALSGLSPGGSQGDFFLEGKEGEFPLDGFKPDRLNESLDAIRMRYGFCAILRASTILTLRGKLAQGKPPQGKSVKSGMGNYPVRRSNVRKAMAPSRSP